MLNSAFRVMMTMLLLQVLIMEGFICSIFGRVLMILSKPYGKMEKFIACNSIQHNHIIWLLVINQKDWLFLMSEPLRSKLSIIIVSISTNLLVSTNVLVQRPRKLFTLLGILSVKICFVFVLGGLLTI